MEETVPGSRRPMEIFFELAEECNEAYMYFNGHIFDGVDKDGYTLIDESLFMKKYPNFLRVAEYPFNKVLRKIGMPEDAIDILNVYWTYIGMDYERLSFIHMAWMFLMYVKYKPAICEYNAHGMTMAGIERLRELGAEVWLNVKANKVVSDDKGNITGVETDVGFVETHYVIANMNPQDEASRQTHPRARARDKARQRRKPRRALLQCLRRAEQERGGAWHKGLHHFHARQLRHEEELRIFKEL